LSNRAVSANWQRFLYLFVWFVTDLFGGYRFKKDKKRNILEKFGKLHETIFLFLTICHLKLVK